MYIKLRNYSRAKWKWCQESFDGCFLFEASKQCFPRIQQSFVDGKLSSSFEACCCSLFCQIAGISTFLTSHLTIRSKMRLNFRWEECSTNSYLKIVSKQNCQLVGAESIQTLKLCRHYSFTASTTQKVPISKFSPFAMTIVTSNLPVNNKLLMMKNFRLALSNKSHLKLPALDSLTHNFFTQCHMAKNKHSTSRKTKSEKLYTRPPFSVAAVSIARRLLVKYSNEAFYIM